jgi:hypothetical protein
MLLAVSGCDRFPRDNPAEKKGTGELTIERSEEPVIVSDAVGAGPFNNANGKVEARETVLLTVPLEVSHSATMSTVSVMVEDRNDGRCVSSVVERGASGNQLEPLSLPSTTGDDSASAQVGTIEVTLGSEGCDPAMPVELALRFGVAEDGDDIAVPFTIDVAALDGMVALDSLVVEDESGDGEQDLDAGETVVLFPSLQNTGDALLRRIELEVDDEGRVCVGDVRIRRSPSGSLELGDVAPGQTVAGGTGTIELTVDSACGDGDQVELVFDVRDASDQRWKLSWSGSIASGFDAGPAADGGLATP